MAVPLGFDPLTVMGLPSTRVYHSFNGKIYLGGLPIIRVSRANFTISNNPDLYPEVGRREATPYVREFDVRGSYTRAYINGAEWRLAIGLQPGAGGVFNPGSIYTGQDMADLFDAVASDTWSNERGDRNTYPVKTDASLDINMIDRVPVEGTTGDGKALQATIIGIMIDAATLTVGRGGDLITSGPIDWIGEKVSFGYG